jgi:DNA-binding transcriptional ArsR family regulator
MRNNLRTMRSSTAIEALFPRTRQGILAATFLHPDRWWYLSDLAQHLRVRPSSLQRELSALVEAGILHRRRDGNRIYYQPDPECPFLTELQGLLAKTAGLADILKEALQLYETLIDFAFVYGSIAQERETSTSDVDLMIIGPLRLAELSPALREAERCIQRPVSPTIYTWGEFSRKLHDGNHFLSTVMGAEKFFLKGDERELAEALIREKNQATYDQPHGAG